jgi:hypothetical protein
MKMTGEKVLATEDDMGQFLRFLRERDEKLKLKDEPRSAKTCCLCMQYYDYRENESEENAFARRLNEIRHTTCRDSQGPSPFLFCPECLRHYKNLLENAGIGRGEVVEALCNVAIRTYRYFPKPIIDNSVYRRPSENSPWTFDINTPPFRSTNELRTLFRRTLYAALKIPDAQIKPADGGDSYRVPE